MTTKPINQYAERSVISTRLMHSACRAGMLPLDGPPKSRSDRLTGFLDYQPRESKPGGARNERDADRDADPAHRPCHAAIAAGQ